jgi:hypothetical protein
MLTQAAYHNLCDQKGGRGGEKAMMDDYDNDNEFEAQSKQRTYKQ